jgi:hypothetical protein
MRCDGDGVLSCKNDRVTVCLSFGSGFSRAAVLEMWFLASFRNVEPGHKDEWYAALMQNRGYWERTAVFDGEIEDRHINLFSASRVRSTFGIGPAHDDLVAEFIEHIGDEHTYRCLVFDYQDTFLGRGQGEAG